MASDVFLILPGIPGESQDRQFEKSIHIKKFTYGMSASGGLMEPPDKPSVDQIVVSKWVDSASMPLLRALAEGRRLDSGRILIRHVGATVTPPTPQPLYLAIDLRGVHVRGVEVEHSSEGEVAWERVTLAFERIRWTYTPLSSTGTPLPNIVYEYTVA
jgi:type VI secretion system secreted protein Hcp